MQLKETLNKLISFMPFGFAKESVRQAHHERNQLLTVRLYALEGTEDVEGLNQSFLKTRIRRSFGSATVSYDSVAQLQRNAGKGLLKKLGEGGKYGTVVDLGCGTGFLVNELVKRFDFTDSCLVALDIALPMLQSARKKLIGSHRVHYLCADVECLPLAAQSADLVVSNLAFQWCTDLSKTFAEIKRLLKPGGRVLFTTFGPSTLRELKEAWGKVDNYSHVNVFHTESQIAGLLGSVGFSAIDLDTVKLVSTYPSVWDLMAELKSLGARTVISGGNKHLTGKSTMQRMVCAYQKQAGSGLVPATFEIITACAVV